MGRAVQVLLTVALVLAIIPSVFSGQLYINNPIPTINGALCTCETDNSDGLASTDHPKFVGDKLFFTVNDAQKCNTQFYLDDIIYEFGTTAGINRGDTDSIVRAGTCQSLESDSLKIGQVHMIGYGEIPKTRGIVKSAPLTKAAPRNGDILLQSGIMCGNKLTAMFSTYSTAPDANLEYGPSTGAVISCRDYFSPIYSQLQTKLRAFSEGTLLQENHINPKYSSFWAITQPVTYKFPLGAECAEYELQIIGSQTGMSDTKVKIETDITDKQGKIITVPSNGNSFSVYIYEAANRIPEKIELRFVASQGNIGAFGYAIVCKGATTTPDTTEYACSAAGGLWEGVGNDPLNGACCYGATLNSPSPDNTKICRNNNGYVWADARATDSADSSCTGGLQDGLMFDPQYCCEAIDYQPYQPDQPYFCNKGTVDRTAGPVSAPGENEWIWNGADANSPGTWLKCEDSSRGQAVNEYLCAYDGTNYFFEQCNCPTGNTAGCGEKTEKGYYCSPNNVWSTTATPGACSANDVVNGKCCFWGTYEVEEITSNGQTHTRACFNGEIVEEAAGTPTVVLAQVMP